VIQNCRPLWQLARDEFSGRTGSPSAYFATSTWASNPALAFAFGIGEGSACATRMVASPAFSQVPLELGFRRAKALMVARFEKAFLSRALAESRGNISVAARLAGKERRAFGKLLKKHGIDRADYQKA
jgi:Bacterial regulatory protein, Fis family